MVIKSLYLSVLSLIVRVSELVLSGLSVIYSYMYMYVWQWFSDLL